MDTGEGIRFQVGLAILTGVLVIVITTAVVISMGQKSTVDNFDQASNPLPTLPVPSQVVARTSGPTTAPSSPGKKPTKSTSPTTAPPALALSCEAHEMAVSATMYCTVSVTPAAPSTLTITLDTSTADITLPGSTSILGGSSFSDPFLINGQSSSGGSTMLTAKAIGLTSSFAVTVTPA